jgi:transcriptional regulator with XRE-family HTH domain
MGKRRPKPQHDAAYQRLRSLLREWRLDAGLTQQNLADTFGRPHTFAHKVESGDRRIDPIEFARWASACGIKPEEAMRLVAQAARIG